MTVLLFLIITTAISILGLLIAIMYKSDTLTGVFGFVLGLLVALGWLLFGCKGTIERKFEKIPREKIEIIVGKDRVVVTETELNKTVIFEGAKVYNAVTKDKDSTFYIERCYNMYGYEIEVDIEKYIKK